MKISSLACIVALMSCTSVNAITVYSNDGRAMSLKTDLYENNQAVNLSDKLKTDNTSNKNLLDEFTYVTWNMEQDKGSVENAYSYELNKVDSDPEKWNDEHYNLAKIDPHESKLFSKDSFVTKKFSVDNSKDSLSLSFGEQKAEDKATVMLGADYSVDTKLVGPVNLSIKYKSSLDKESNILVNDKTDNSISAAMSLGNKDSGFYLASIFSKVTEKTNSGLVFNSLDTTVNKYGIESGYTFENGLGLFVGFNYVNVSHDSLSKHDDFSFTQIPVTLRYSINPNFNIWTQAQISDEESDRKGSQSESSVSAGARYTF